MSNANSISYKDGRITLEEFKRSVNGYNIEAFFNRLDLNHDEFFTLDECFEIFDNADKNSDGILDESELYPVSIL